MFELEEFITSSGKSYFRDWFKKIDTNAAYIITNSLYKLKQGNVSNAKFLGHGIWEFKINSGPGYRIYFAKIGSAIILLLAGGIKRTQDKDIILATNLFRQYKDQYLH